MGLYLTDAPFTSFTCFFWSFFLAWILNILGAVPFWWILILGLGVLFFHKYLPSYDFGAANVFCRWAGGQMGKLENGATHQEFLFTLALQFLGSFAGAILYDWIFGTSPVPVPVTFVSKENGKLFCLFAFANFFQAYAVNRIKTADTSLDNSWRLAAAYMLSWFLCQAAYGGSIGGVTIDAGRLVAGKLAHTKLVPKEQFKKIWILLVGPVAGWAVAFLYQMAEYMMKAKQDGTSCKKDDDAAAEEPAADNNAEENA